MTLKELEAKVQALEKEEKELKARVQNIEDIEAVKKVQKAYAYYLQRWEWRKVVDLFSDAPDASVEIGGLGNYVGKKGIIKAFQRGWGEGPIPPEFLHTMLACNGYAEVDPGGKTAESRFYWFGVQAGMHQPLPEDNLRARWSLGIWQTRYVKEDGKWKIKRLYAYHFFNVPYEDGWGTKTVRTRPAATVARPADAPPPGPGTVIAPYPSGYLLPYFFKNPVTGK